MGEERYGEGNRWGAVPGKPVLETRRLRMAPASDEEMERLIAAEADEETQAAYGEMRMGCRNYPAQRLWYAAWMVSRPDGAMVGDFCFKGPAVEGMVEIGYGMRPEYEGQGYATEVVQAAVAWALAQPGVRGVEAETEPHNRASQRVLEKCGFVPNGKRGAEGPRFVRWGRGSE